MSLPDEALHEMDMADMRAEVLAAEALLSKLNVADLRVLAKRYWKIDDREARTLGKRVLVSDLACENGAEILDDMWRARPRKTA
jgi:hypothetical protein